jgi:N utilization substance protein A
MFLGKLFELEIPEIYDGIIEIKGIAREPGERAKVAVESHDDRIDPVGACVGMKGVRIHAIVRELNNENIDVITWSEDPLVLLQRALAPAKLKSLTIDEENKTATIVVDKQQASLAIGRNGQNVRLASKLTGFDIKVEQEGVEEEYDVDLVQFREELSDVLYARLVDEGFETARDVIEANDEDLLLVEGMDLQKIHELKDMLRSGIEEADLEEDEDENEPALVDESPGEGFAEEESEQEDKSIIPPVS